MKRKRIWFLLIALAAAMLSACGGGGGGGGNNAGPTAVVLTLSSQGAPAFMSGLGITVTLPEGVSVKTDSSGDVDSSVVTVSGAAAGQATSLAIYSSATTTLPATLDIVVSSTTSAGFAVGEFATVQCIIQSGSPKASDFSLTGFDPRDLNAAPISGMTATFTAVIQ